MKSILMLGCLAALSGSAAALESSALLSSFNAAAALTRQAKENFQRPIGMMVAGSPAASGPIVSQPGESPFVTLERFYKESNTAANLADFDELGKTSTQECVDAYPDNANLTRSQVKRVSMTTPGNGPLFPEKKEEKLIYSSGRGNSSSLFKYTEMSRTSTDFVLTLAKNSAIGGTPAVINLRKSGGLIAFQVTLYRGESKEATHYGYCFR